VASFLKKEGFMTLKGIAPLIERRKN